MSADDPSSGVEGEANASLRADVAQLTDRVMQLESDVETLTARLDQLAGLAEDERSTPKSRARDIVMGMKNAASASSGTDSSYVKWDYRQVVDYLEAIGHGDIDGKQAYRAMDWVGENIKGFAYREWDSPKTLAANIRLVNAPSGVDNVNNGDLVSDHESPQNPGGTSQKE